jgi:hypothetical protein
MIGASDVSPLVERPVRREAFWAQQQRLCTHRYQVHKMSLWQTTEPHRDVVGRVGVDLRCCRLVLSSAMVNARGMTLGDDRRGVTGPKFCFAVCQPAIDAWGGYACSKQAG